MERDDLILSGHMVNANTLSTYANEYLKGAFTFLQVSPPYQNVNDYYVKKDYRNTLMDAIFGAGALLMGSKAHATSFVKAIETSIQTSFDDIDPYLCGAYFVLSGFFSSVGDHTKEIAYNNRALVMAKLLKKKMKVEVQGIDVARVEKCSYIKQSLCHETLDDLSNLITSMPQSDTDQLSWTSVHIQNYVLLWSIKAIHELDANFIQPSNMHRMRTLLNYGEGFIRKLPKEFQSGLLIRLFAARIVLNVIAVNDDQANLAATQLLELTSDLHSSLFDNHYFVLTPLIIVGQFYLLFGTFTNEFQKFSKVAAKVDTANIVRGLLNKEISRGNVDDMVSWSYFYPRLATYRDMNSQTMALLNHQQPHKVGGLSINSLIE
jgi:hypothetical protein